MSIGTLIILQKWLKNSLLTRIVAGRNKSIHHNKDKSKQIYLLAEDSIQTLPSTTPSTKMLVQESVKILREVSSSLSKILLRMQELYKELPEYDVVRAMNEVGDIIAPRLIAEIGDIRHFHRAKALVAYAGIDFLNINQENPMEQTGIFLSVVNQLYGK